ncbi:MAG: translation initiation factor IF-3 [Pseudomonadota bacterium]
MASSIGCVPKVGKDRVGNGIVNYRNGDGTIKRSNPRGRVQDKRPPMNERITEDQVRLIDSDGEQLGIVPTSEALERAEAAGMDLVQISNADPIVCKIMDYGKFVFEQKKQKAAQKKKTKQIQVKEVKFRPNTDEGDYQVKLKNLTRFLESGDKGKVTLRFRGREMAHQDIGRRLMERVAADLEEIGTVESFPKMEGRQMIMILAPKKK